MFDAARLDRLNVRLAHAARAPFQRARGREVVLGSLEELATLEAVTAADLLAD